MAIRSLVWISLAAIFTYCTSRYSLEMTTDRLAGIFDGKLSLFGIIIVIAIFQLGRWRELSQQFETTLRQSARAEREEHEATMRDVAGAGVVVVSDLGSRLDRMRRLEHARRLASQARAYMRRRILPTNTALLTNSLLVEGFLLVSICSDVALFMLKTDVRTLRVVSTTAFVSIWLPILEMGGRYFLALYSEFSDSRSLTRERNE
jgi:hypothetical protein